MSRFGISHPTFSTIDVKWNNFIQSGRFFAGFRIRRAVTLRTGRRWHDIISSPVLELTEVRRDLGRIELNGDGKQLSGGYDPIGRLSASWSILVGVVPYSTNMAASDEVTWCRSGNLPRFWLKLALLYTKAISALSLDRYIRSRNGICLTTIVFNHGDENMNTHTHTHQNITHTHTHTHIYIYIYIYIDCVCHLYSDKESAFH